MAKGDISTEYNAYMQALDGTGVVDINKMVNFILPRLDTSGWSREMLERAYLKGILGTMLNADKYRSVIWGKGAFVNPMRCNNESLIRIFKTANKAEKAKQRMVWIYKNQAIKNGIPGQYEYDPETNDYVPQMTDEELLDLLFGTGTDGEFL